VAGASVSAPKASRGRSSGPSREKDKASDRRQGKLL